MSRIQARWIPVHVFDTRHEILEILSGKIVGKGVAFGVGVHALAALHELEPQEELVIIGAVYHLKQLDYVGMVKQLHHPDLVLHVLHREELSAGSYSRDERLTWWVCGGHG